MASNHVWQDLVWARAITSPSRTGWRCPFAEVSVGGAWADARHYTVNGEQRGLGENFNFNFALAAGLRYDVNDR